MATYVLFRLAGLVVPLIPRRLGYALMGVLAALFYRLSGSSRSMIQCNVRHVLGASARPSEVDRVARRIFHNLLKNYFDLFWLPAQPADKIARMVSVHGLENIKDAFGMGKGVVAVSMHIGNQEVMTQVRAVTDQRLTVVAEHVKNERLFRYLVSLRQTSGIHLIPNDGALMELLRALRRGEAIGLVFDRDVAGGGRVIPFFGSPACFPDGYALLALRHGVPVLPSIIVREPDDSYAAYIEKPMLFQGNARNDEDVRRVMASVGVVAERFVARFLDQWVYFHYVWEDDKERVNCA
jgi:KDO2-lipid IV(A) lauroyltransferase